MAEPKQKIARSTSKTRRGRKKTKTQLLLIKCTHCGEKILSHRICPECGHYKNKNVISVK